MKFLTVFSLILSFLMINTWTKKAEAEVQKPEAASFAIYAIHELVLKTDTDTKEFDLYGGILEEFGFHSSAKDCAFIIQEETRQKRVAAALTTAIQAKYMFEDLHEKSLSK